MRPTSARPALPPQPRRRAAPGTTSATATGSFGLGPLAPKNHFPTPIGLPPRPPSERDSLSQPRGHLTPSLLLRHGHSSPDQVRRNTLFETETMPPRSVGKVESVTHELGEASFFSMDEQDYYSCPFDPNSFKKKYIKYLSNRVINGDRETHAPEYLNFTLKGEQIAAFQFEAYVNIFLNKTDLSNQKIFSFASLIVTLCYIDVFLEKQKGVLNSKICHKLFFISLITAYKYIEDRTFSFGYFAAIGFIPQHLLAILEVEFLKECQHKLFIEQKKFYEYIKMFEEMGCTISPTRR